MSFWADDKIETLKAMLREGASAAEIAARIRGATRSSVLGKIHRLGLAALRPNVRPKVGPKKRAESLPAKLAGRDAPKVNPSSGAVAPPSPARGEGIPAAGNAPGRISSAERAELTKRPAGGLTQSRNLEPGACRFPYGDPLDDGFGFCALPARAGSSYCAGHHALCYVPSNPVLDRGLARSAAYFGDRDVVRTSAAIRRAVGEPRGLSVRNGVLA